MLIILIRYHSEWVIDVYINLYTNTRIWNIQQIKQGIEEASSVEGEKTNMYCEVMNLIKFNQNVKA
jgi:hypothetical protein